MEKMERKNGMLSELGYQRSLRCNRCGFCLSVCPTYQNSHKEIQSARGRVHLLRMLEHGKFDWRNDPGISAEFNNCLLCGACYANCPAGAETHEMMAEARDRFMSVKGFSLFHKFMYRGMLSHQKRLERCSIFLRAYKFSQAGKVFEVKAIQKAFAKLRFLESYLPEISKPARVELKEEYLPQGKPLFKVAYFLGCATNVFYPSVAKALVGHLVASGVQVVIPRVDCCGGPHYSAGDRDLARRLARANLAAMEAHNADYIVSDCATCAHTLHEYSVLFEQDDPIQERLAALKTKLFDINTFLDQVCFRFQLY